MYIVHYSARITATKYSWFWIRPEHTANNHKHATRFASVQDAYNYITGLNIPDLVMFRIYHENNLQCAVNLDKIRG